MAKKPRLGSGARFAKVAAAAARSGARDPAAVAASIGRSIYGNAKMQQMAAAGKKRAAAKRKA